MNSDQISKIYFEHINGNASEEGKLNRIIENTDYFKMLAKIKPKNELKKKFDRYRNESDRFTDNDYIDLNSEIYRNGVALNTGGIFFHGCAKKITITDKPISCTTHPAYAIWHARKHRNHELNGKPIYVYILHITGVAEVKSCMDFQDPNFGHENEVVFQAGVKLEETQQTEISNQVFIIESNV